MNILVISSTPWSSNNSFGNTYSNLFEGMGGLTFANIALKPVTETDPIVDSCFSISENALIANLLHSRLETGREVDVKTTLAKDLSGGSRQTEFAVKEFARKKRWMIMFWARDLIWKLGRWKSPQLLKYLDAVKPDLIFQPIYFVSHPNDIVHFVKKYTGVPMVGYVSDDVYTLCQFSLSPFYWLDRIYKRRKVKRTIQQCEILYVISELQKQEYEKIFGVPCKILTKCADFSGEPLVKTQYNTPLQLVFTGNIGTNRWKSLAMIAEALEQINQNGVRAQLRIYTATPLTAKMEKALQKGESSFIMGSIPASEVPKTQADADILVHVEATDLKNKLAVRQSFSTKLVDYFKTARPILAVGPRDVASIDHLIRNDCALTGETVEEVKQALLSVLDNPDKLNDLSRKAYACGKKNHNKEKMQQMLQADLSKIVKEERA